MAHSWSSARWISRISPRALKIAASPHGYGAICHRVGAEELLDHIAIARILRGEQLGGDPAHALEAPQIVGIFAIPVQPFVRDCAQLIGPQAQPLPQIR